MEDYSETKFTETLLEWYPDSGTVMEVLELIDNESSKLSKGKISIYTNTFCHLISIIILERFLILPRKIILGKGN